jgi:hypothetical protein
MLIFNFTTFISRMDFITLTVKEVGDKLNINSHNIGQQLHSYKQQGLVRAIRQPNTKILLYEISERGVSRLDFLKKEKAIS